MNEYAEIIVHQTILEPTGARYYTYEWQGKKHSPVYLRYELLLGEYKLPWSFLKIEDHPSRASFLCIRKDALLPFGFLLITKIKLTNAAEWIYYRLIATLMIWGLAYIPNGEIPSWKHIGKKPL